MNKTIKLFLAGCWIFGMAFIVPLGLMVITEFKLPELLLLVIICPGISAIEFNTLNYWVENN